MSKYSEKLLRGEIPNEEDWANHLIEAHKNTPSMSPNAFAPYRTIEDKSSYEVLAETLRNPKEDKVVLDLACGDGYLIPFLLPRLSNDSKVIGVDMSRAELAVATKTIADPRVSFYCAKAQSLPLGNESVDLICCHMSFMLMLPLEPVVSEIARILKPGGRFAAVVSSPKGGHGIFADIQQLVGNFLTTRYPAMKKARSGDPRVHSEDGLREIFHPDSGFRFDGVAPIQLVVRTTPDAVWTFLKDVYFIGMLPDVDKEELRKEIVSFVSNKVDTIGVVNFGFPMKRFVVSKVTSLTRDVPLLNYATG